MEHKEHKECCPTDIPAVISNYKGIGSFEKLEVGDEKIDLYVTGSGSKGVLLVYDIFGMHPNPQQVADLIGKQGYTVVIPDFFRGNPWPTDDFPSKEPGAVGKWINDYPYDKKIKPVMLAAVEYLKKKGVTSVGAVGFCWGGKMVFLASGDHIFKSIATAHPSFLQKEDAEKISGPTCVLPSKDESPMEDIHHILKHNKWHKESIWQRFDDMHHGWVGARGGIPTDYNDKKTANRAGEAISIFINFFNHTL